MEDQVMPATKCGDCKHESICKYVDEMTNVQMAVYNIKTSLKSPITIYAECSTYERRQKKQDGIVYR